MTKKKVYFFLLKIKKYKITRTEGVNLGFQTLDDLSVNLTQSIQFELSYELILVGLSN